MANSLNLDEEWGDVEVVEATEKAFGVSISEHVAHVYTVGQLFDVLRIKIEPDATRQKCANAMAFYRLRRLLRDFLLDAKLSPSSDLSNFRALYTKSLKKRLEKKLDLQLPKPGFTWIGNLGVIGVVGFYCGLVSFAAGVVTLLFSHVVATTLLKAGASLFVSGIGLAIILAALDPGRLPDDYRTLGDFTKRVAALNFGFLVGNGAGTKDRDLWEALLGVLSEYSDTPVSEITRETFFFERAYKKAKAAA